MAGECTETTPLATTSSIHNWWPQDHLHASSLSSWSTNNYPNWQYSEPNNNSESSGEESVSISTSFTNASNHSGLTVESSRRVLVDGASAHEIVGERVPDNHLWSHVLLGGGNNGDLPSSQDFEEQLLNELPPKSISTGMFDAACDYSKKIDNSWLSSSMGPFNSFEKPFNTPKSSNFVGNWSIPSQDEDLNQQFEPRQTAIVTLNSMIKEPFSDLGQGKRSVDRILGSISCFGHDMKMVEEYGRSFDSDKVGTPTALGSTTLGDKSKYSLELPIFSPCSNSRSLTEALSSVGYLSRPLLDTNVCKPIRKTLDLSGFKKQVFQSSPFPTPKSTISTLARNNRRTQALLSGGKRKRSEENPETVMKKPKQEASTISTTKLQVPKAKLADKITALQQIVSPFGKTDTASVLWETIGYIRFLQEQIQLLSSPYMKGYSSKDLWGGLGRKDRGEANMDLRSRGLCLVPISCAPQVCRENSGSDYLTPMYRGCLYR
uniref:BHLH transcription factor bHLH15.7 n=1 Tax=Gardenia jasminoides TaxID=114476 RepID=A0A6M4C9I0_GARJA|nr:bHLH transcription factor bHLH15.7 [Gardenia jasminoides]